jgi:hypothetical protein
MICFGTTSVKIDAVSATQAVLEVDTNRVRGACTYQVSESSTLSPLVHDVDPTLFPGSNADSRPGASIGTGATRFFVAGTRSVDLATNGSRYSRALVANTVHYFQVSCGPDVATGQFTTANPPLGSTYPELPKFDSTAFGNLSDPTINWIDQSVSYVDSLTGIRLWRATGPGQNGQLVPPTTFNYALDVNGGAWTNPNNALTSGNPSTLATTSKLNAPLFLAWNELHNYQLNWAGANFNPYQGTVDDLKLNLYGSGPGSQVSVCVSLNSGASCASQSITVSLPSSTGYASPVPSTYPTPIFAGWGAEFSDWGISNRSSSSGATGSAGSTIIQAPTASFSIDWPSGAKIKITGSGCNGNDVCTVASVQSSAQITIRESLPKSVSNAAWQSYAAGLRVSLVSGGSASIAGTFEYAESFQNLLDDTQHADYCSPLSVSDVYTDRNGNPISVPLTGRLCNFGNGLYLVVNGTGEVRLLSDYVMNSTAPVPGGVVHPSSTESFSTTDPKSFYGVIYYHSGFFKGTYSGNYAPYKLGGSSPYLGYTGSPANDAVTWTNLMPSGSPQDVAVQFPSYPGMSFFNADAGTGMFNPPAFSAMLNGYAEFYVTPPAAGDPLCVVVMYDVNQQKIVQALKSWDTYPMRWGACHFSPSGAGTYQIGSFNSLQGQNPGYQLNGPFQLNLTQVMKGGVWSNNTSMTESEVLYASDTSPVVITTVSTYTDAGTNMANIHGLADKEPVVIWGATANTAINSPSGGVYYVKASWSNTTLASAVNPTTTTIPLTSAAKITASPMILVDSEYIRCSGVSGNSLTGCVRGSSYSTPASHSSGAAVTQTNAFALYQDANLTIPVTGNGTYQFNFATYVMDLDQCPSGLASQWTTAMLFDNVGATGRRCNTIRVAGESYSNYPYWTQFSQGNGLTGITVSNGVATIQLSNSFTAWKAGQQVVISGAPVSALNGTFTLASVPSSTTATFSVTGVANGTYNSGVLLKHPTEHYAYPWLGSPNNLNTSSLQNLQVGDFIHDFAQQEGGEELVVVQETKNSNTDIVLTVMRYWGNQVNCDQHMSNTNDQQHLNGWVPYMVPSFGCANSVAYANITDNTWTIGDYRIGQEHGDIGPGASSGTYTYVSSGDFTPISNVGFQQIMTQPPVGGVINEFPTFAGSGAELTYSNTTQGYGAFRQTVAPASEKVWKADFHALNNAYGAPQDTPLGLIGGMNLTSIRGTPYDSTSSTSTVYHASSLPSTLDRKHIPMLGFAGYRYFSDMSGPGSLIADSSLYQFCVADFAGECRPNSKQGDVFMEIPAPDPNPSGNCITNIYEETVPCLFSANSYGGWGVQQEINPPDTNAAHGRRVTAGFMNPGRHFTFANWVPTPDAQYGFLSPPWINGLRNDIFMMKLPPWPAADGVNRSTFINVSVTVAAVSGATTARARFGYAENGPAANLYCTSRKETCTTSGSPFVWLSEPQVLQSCYSGCTIEVPAIAGRVVYYQIDWMDSTGHVLSSSPLTPTIAAP